MSRFSSVHPYLLTDFEGATTAIAICARASMPVKMVTTLPGCSFVDMNAKSMWMTGLRSWMAGCGECVPCAWIHTARHPRYGKWVNSWSSRSCLLGSWGERSPRGRIADSDCWRGSYSSIGGNIKFSYRPTLGWTLSFSIQTVKPLQSYGSVWSCDEDCWNLPIPIS